MFTRQCKFCHVIFKTGDPKIKCCSLEHAREYSKKRKQRYERNRFYRECGQPEKAQKPTTNTSPIILPNSARTLDTSSIIPGYSVNWKEISTQIRIRDNYTCQYCGDYFDESRVCPPVHHIVPRRFLAGISAETAEHPDNLITLCEKCHPLIEYGHLKLPTDIVKKAYRAVKKGTAVPQNDNLC